jgi:hypothetical protein
MIHTAYIILTWIVGIVAVLGPIGAIAAFFLIPTVAVPIMTKFATAFLGCTRCVVATVFVIAGVGSYWVGHYDAASDCKEAQIAAQLATKNRDLEAAQKAKDDETQRANKIEADANARQKDDADYIATLEKRPSCALDDSDLGGLRKSTRRIGTKPPARP